MSTGGVPQGLRMVATVAATFLGGSFAIGFLSSSISERLTSFKKKKYGRPCRTCKAIGYYACKLCKGNGTINWSPLYDPVFINPCICPTCDGFKVGCNAVLTAWDTALYDDQGHDADFNLVLKEEIRTFWQFSLLRAVEHKIGLFSRGLANGLSETMKCC